MTKKESKGLSNEELILKLCTMMAESRIYKSSMKDAKIICKELENRKLIENGDGLYQQWERKYLL